MRSRNRAGKAVAAKNLFNLRYNNSALSGRRRRLTRQEKDLEMFKINFSRHPDRKHWRDIKDNAENGEARFWWWAAMSGCKR